MLLHFSLKYPLQLILKIHTLPNSYKYGANELLTEVVELNHLAPYQMKNSI